jgi:hypothetical protein
MTERAQQIMDVFYKDEDLDGDFIPDKIVVANVLRKLNSIFAEEGYGGDEFSWRVFSEIIDIIDELEAL